MFPPGKSGREIYWEIEGFEISRFPGDLCRDREKFFCSSKDFIGTDINRSEMKNALGYCKKIFFCLLKIIFQSSQNFFRRNACEIKIFFSVCRKHWKTQTKFVKTA